MQFREDVELLRAGYQAKLRALEMLWLVPSGEALPEERPVLGVNESLRLSETLSVDETLPETPAPAAARRRGQVLEDVLACFAGLPEIFDQRDVVRALGYTVSRATLFRVFGELLREERIVMEEPGSGPNPTRYRKLPAPLDADGDLG
jgi:hypothetical protein